MTVEQALNKLDETFIGDLELKIFLTKALEKQIPKKPITLPIGFETFWRDTIRSVQCKVCRDVFMQDTSIKYCPSCGQALDWGDK